MQDTDGNYSFSALLQGENIANNNTELVFKRNIKEYHGPYKLLRILKIQISYIEKVLSVYQFEILSTNNLLLKLIHLPYKNALIVKVE